MTDYEQKKIEMELKAFIARNFEKPLDCKNQDQIRFYVGELSHKVEALERQFNYVPEWAYSLLSQYNAAQNRILDLEFKNSYC
jgi:hypothetical protein